MSTSGDRRSASLNRRRLLAGAAALGAAPLAGCDRFARTGAGQAALQAGEDASLYVQRLLLSEFRLAREYAEADISPWFKPNGTDDPPDRDYKALARRRFADFRLAIDGLVERPAKLSLTDLRKLPSRTQITRHDCVEGWSCIGKWTGVPVRELLQQVGLKPNARYVLFHCADTMEGGEADEEGGETNNPQMEQRKTSGQTPSGSSGDDGGDDDAAAEPVRYYETIDLTDAYHPQTILAYDMNGAALPVAHGAPLRLRLERQLGYKMAKYVMRLELVESFADIGDGKGGYWEDRGYDWYAGI